MSVGTVLTEGSNVNETLNNVKEVEPCVGPVIGAVPGVVEDAEKSVDEVFMIPEFGEMEPMAKMYFQLFSYYVVDTKGGRSISPETWRKA